MTARAWWLVALAACGCGYSFGVDEFGAGSRAIGVTVVDNRSFRQGIEIPLTREIHRALARHTDFRQTSVDRADAVLAVTIADLEGQAIVRGGVPAPVREGSLDFTVGVRLVDRATGLVLQEHTVLDRAEFRTAVGENYETATDEAVFDLARKIVLALESDF